MKLTIERINHIVEQERDRRHRYILRASRWERMYFSQQFAERPGRQVAESEGKETIVLPTTFNVVHLGMRLISDTPRIEVPSCHATAASDEYALAKKKFLTAMWQRVNDQQQQNVIDALKWSALVRGRFAFEVKWIQDSLPKTLRDSKFPILIRPLDPFNIGVIRGPYWTEFAYVREENVPRWKLKGQFPKLKFGQNRPRAIRKDEEDEEHTVIDAWWTDQATGKVWNAIIVDDEFAKAPVETDYPEVPIIEGYGDTTQSTDEGVKGLSILYPMEGTWEYTNRLVSQMATGLLWYFWPHIAVSNEEGRPLPDKLVVRPGETTVYPWGTKIDPIQMNPNVPLAQNVLTQVDSVQQQSTFPGVLYGEAPGELQAGYGVNILAQAAAGRTVQFRTNLENGVKAANRIVLGMIEALAGSKGVNAWGNVEGDGMYEVTLTPKQIEGYYENDVKLASDTFQDEQAKIATLIQLKGAGVLSTETVRQLIPWKLPTDERRRVELEQLLQSPSLQQKTWAMAAMTYFPDIWETMLKGTDIEVVAKQTAEDMGIPVKEPLPPPAPPMEQAPPGMDQGMMPPQGMGPGPMEGGPMGGPMMEPGMMGGGPVPLQPEALPMAQGGGIPPEMQGQMTPEQMGLPPDLPPEIWGMLTGDPMTDQEILRRMMGVQ